MPCSSGNSLTTPVIRSVFDNRVARKTFVLQGRRHLFRKKGCYGADAPDFFIETAELIMEGHLLQAFDLFSKGLRGVFMKIELCVIKPGLYDTLRAYSHGLRVFGFGIADDNKMIQEIVSYCPVPRNISDGPS